MNAGAFYAYVEFGLGRDAGRLAAYLATLGYHASVTSLTAAFGFFASSALRSLAGIAVPWELLAVAVTILAGLLNHAGHRDLHEVARQTRAKEGKRLR